VPRALHDLEELKSRFNLEGWVKVKGFLPPEELALVRGRFDRYVTECIPQVPRETVYYEDVNNPDTLKQMSRMEVYDSYFAGLMRDPSWFGLAEALMGEPVVPQGVEWFNKPPKIGKPTPPHQDGFYFMLEPNEALTFWLALDPVNEENGCLRYVSGSHRTGVRPHARTSVLGFSQGVSKFSPEDRAAEVAVPAEPGDMLIHHSLTIHRAGNNPTERHRRSLGLVYYAQRAHVDKEKSAAYQKQLSEELIAAGKI
jgi:phytanoyl-CoA hydroxylase